MKTAHHKLVKVREDIRLLGDNKFWDRIPKIIIGNYLWMNNSYNPIVETKLCYTDSFMYVQFKVFETEVYAKFTQINDLVHKDSCVEFFINLFPLSTEQYFNFEMNAIGTIHVGFGAKGNRIKLPIEDIENIEISSKLSKPIEGLHGDEFWEVNYKIPFSLFEIYYEQKFKAENAKGNFYKCGDETKYEHYGTWNKIDSDMPNFHLPEYFGDLVFEK